MFAEDFRKENNLIYNCDPNDDNNKRAIYYPMECYSVSIPNWDVRHMRKFKKIIMWNKKFYKMFKHKLPNMVYFDGFTLIDQPVPFTYFRKYERKIRGITIMSKWRPERMPCDLPEFRFNIANKIGYYYPAFCYHKQPIPKYFNIKSMGPTDMNATGYDFFSKLRCLSKYRFHLCFENICHPIYSYDVRSEKLRDCLLSKTVPIYYGSPNIRNHIPKGICILYTNVKNTVKRMLTMGKSEYEDMTEKGYEFAINYKKWTTEYLLDFIRSL